MPATPTIIQAAVTGSQAVDASPYVPATCDAIADAAIAAWEAGASVLHIHAREADGTPTQLREHYEPVVDRIRASRCDAVLNLSCGSAGGRSTGSERLECLGLEPEMASLDCGTLNFGERIFENSPSFLREMAGATRDMGIKPEIECFDVSHIWNALRLRDEGLIEEPIHFQFVLGVRGGAPATMEQVLHMRSFLPAGSTWHLCGVGRSQLALNVVAIVAGGHPRTGLEDNLYYSRGRHAKSSAELVERVVTLCQQLQRPVATPAQAREILGLDGKAVNRRLTAAHQAK